MRRGDVVYLTGNQKFIGALTLVCLLALYLLQFVLFVVCLTLGKSIATQLSIAALVSFPLTTNNHYNMLRTYVPL